MRIYLAAPWVDRKQAAEVAERFEAAGHRITHKWWEVEDTPGTYLSNVDDPYYTECAVQDYLGVVHADALVVLNSGKSEGKAVETGIAVAHFRPIIVIGQRSNIFHYLKQVHVVGSVAEAIDALVDTE